MNMYPLDNEQAFPCAEGPQPGGYRLWMGRWRSFVESYLGGDVTEDNPSVPLCPQDTHLKQGVRGLQLCL